MADNNLELDVVDEIPEAIYDYLSVSHMGNSNFYIVWDPDGIKKEFGFRDSSEMEDFLSELFGYDNWGYDDDYSECVSCGEAIYTQDIFRQDYWIDYEGSGLYCGDCIRNKPEVRDSYLEFLTNNSDASNTILSEADLIAAGLVKLEGDYEYGYYGRTDNPNQILNDLLEKYPNGQFVFDVDSSNRWNVRFVVWAYPGYDEGVEKDEE